MSRCAALLRAVNLGKHRKASSAELRDAFTAAGFEDVVTFRTSGNVAFSTSLRSEAKIRAQAESALATTLGMDVTVFVRTAAELAEIVDAHPFRDVAGAGGGKPQVLFLLGRLDADAQRQVRALGTDEDRLAFVGRDLCWLPQGGVLETRLDWRALDRLTGPTTTRTLGTVDLLVAKHLS